MVLFRWLDRGLGIVSTVILARILVPEDFGLVAMAMSVVALLELMSQFGFDVALIQNRDASREHYDTAWTYSVIFGVVLAFLLYVLAAPAAGFYGDTRLESVLQVCAFAPLVQGLQNIGIVAFRKEMTFNKEFHFLFIRRLVGFAVTLAVAFALRSYWALVLGTIAGRVAGTVLSFYVHPYRPRLSLDAGAELFHFSKWLFFINMLNFALMRSTDFILGKLAGAHALGVYTVSYQIGAMPTTELVAPINRAAMPGYAMHSKDMPKLKQVCAETISFIMTLALPLGVGLSLVAEPAVLLLLGEKWMDAIPLIRTIAVLGTVNALMSNLNQVFLALGNPRVIVVINAVTFVLMMPVLIWSVDVGGAQGAAWTLLAFASATLPVVHVIFFRMCEFPISGYVSLLWRPFFATALMVVAIAWVSTAASDLLSSTGPGVRLLLLISVGGVTYTTALLGSWLAVGRPSGAEATVLGHVTRVARSRHA